MNKYVLQENVPEFDGDIYFDYEAFPFEGNAFHEARQRVFERFTEEIERHPDRRYRIVLYKGAVIWPERG